MHHLAGLFGTAFKFSTQSYICSGMNNGFSLVSCGVDIQDPPNAIFSDVTPLQKVF